MDELLGKDSFFQVVLGIEENLEAHRPVLRDLDPNDVANLVVVGDGTDRALVGVQNIEPDLGLVRQKGATPTPGPVGADRR
jgi:hypothetical protein